MPSSTHFQQGARSLLSICLNLHMHHTGRGADYANAGQYQADLQLLMQAVRDWHYDSSHFDNAVLTLIQTTVTECIAHHPDAFTRSQANLAGQSAFTGSSILHVYCDGACPDNGKPTARSGVGIVLCDEQSTVLKQFSQACPAPHTNQRAEIFAIILALNSIEPHHTVTIFSDSQYVVKTMTEGWARKANTDFWQQLDATVARFTTPPAFTWIKGHSGHPQQELADRLAVQAVS